MIAINYDNYNFANITREYENDVEVELFQIEEEQTIKYDKNIVFSKEFFETIKTTDEL